MPDLACVKIRRFCENQIPPNLRNELRVECDVRGRSITILECRPPWDGSAGEWTRMRVAQIRYDGEAATYSLHWADRNSRWHPYSRLRPTRNVEVILREFDEDPTCIFWG